METALAGAVQIFAKASLPQAGFLHGDLAAIAMVGSFTKMS